MQTRVTLLDAPICLPNSNHHFQYVDWVVDKGNIMNTNSSGGELGMLLTEENGGTRLSSTRYIHYGTITASCMYFL